MMMSLRKGSIVLGLSPKRNRLYLPVAHLIHVSFNPAFAWMAAFTWGSFMYAFTKNSAHGSAKACGEINPGH